MAILRLDLTFQLQFVTDWHVGSGAGSALVNRLQARRRMRSWGEVPFVPGAQLKGVLRQQCERLALALNLSDVLDPHDQEAALAAHFVPLPQSQIFVDRLFGSRYQGGCLFLSDALPVDDHSDGAVSPGTTVRQRTALDRLTGTVKHQHLFATEIVSVSKGAYAARLRARHPSEALTHNGGGLPYEYALLVTALLGIESLGGDKSAGRGQCVITVDESTLKWNRTPQSLDAMLAPFREDGWQEYYQLMIDEKTGSE